MTTAQTRDFISRWPEPVMDADGVSPIIGEVNMERYSRWLHDNYDFDIAYQR